MLSVWVILIECIFLTILTTAGIDSHTFEIDIILIFFFTLSYMLDICRKNKNRVVIGALLSGYFFRIALLFFDLYGRSIFVLPNSGADTEVFYRNAIYYAEGLSYIDWPYVVFLGNIIRIMGRSRIFLQFINLLFSVVTMHITHTILSELNLPLRIRRNIMYILAVLPNYAILTVILLRESIIIMFLAFSLLFFVRWWKYKTIKTFALSVVFVLCGSLFHSGIISVAIGYTVIYIIYNRNRIKIKLTVKNILLIPIFALAFALLFYFYGDIFFAHFRNITDIGEIANTRIDGGSSYGNIVGDSSSLWSMIIHTPLRMIYFLFSPFPWDWRGISDIIAFVCNSLFYAWVIIGSLRFIKYNTTENRSLAISLLIVALLVLFVFSWGVSNTGTAIRHRDKVVVLYVVLWAISWNTNDGLAYTPKSIKR